MHELLEQQIGLSNVDNLNSKDIVVEFSDESGKNVRAEIR